MTRLGRPWLLLAVLLAATPLRADTALSAPAVAALTGASREQIVTLLGRPTKSKVRKDGETLVYRLFRVEGEASTEPDLLLVQVPGVGLVGQRLSETHPPDGSETTYEPSVLDDRGRMVGGGPTRSSGRSATWDKDKHKFVTDEPEEVTRTALRKLKLTLHLDRAGRVTAWSVRPRQKGDASTDGDGSSR